MTRLANYVAWLVVAACLAVIAWCWVPFFDSLTKETIS